MSEDLSRRNLFQLGAGAALTSLPVLSLGQGGATTASPPTQTAGPVEAPFERDYKAPDFKPAWKKQQLNRLMVQDFVIFAHFDLAMTKQLLAKEPKLITATMDWGGGDWESGLNGASHLGNKDIVNFLLEKGARMDIFCAAMMNQLDAVRQFLTLQPALIDALGPHGITLHKHAQMGKAKEVYEYLQTIKKIG